MSKVLTPARRARLEKLAAYLEGLPRRYKHFDMLDYIEVTDEEKEAEYARHNGGVAKCGTVACAVGHGPAAGILFPRSMVSKLSWGWSVNWTKYAELFTGPSGYGDPGESLFAWLFSSQWKDVDNHHFGAAARIRYALAHGGEPEGFWNPASEYRALYAPYRIDASADTRRMAETALAGSGRSPSGAVPAKQGDAQ